MRLRRGTPAPVPKDVRLEAERGQLLVEESRENVLVLDEQGVILAASRRARESIPELLEGAPVPKSLLSGSSIEIPYEVDGRRERLVYLRDPGDLGAYEELRAGFTASVSHELRTPLARVLALLETALLPESPREELIDQARAEIAQAGELIDDVLFISELESGREVVGLGATVALPVLRDTAEELEEQASRAGVTLVVQGDESAELPLRPRMIRVVGKNLAENAIRYAGPGSTFTLTISKEDRRVVVVGRDDGVGVGEDDLPRLFERFYRTDRARASRGTGLGLAIVKHVVTSAGGVVEATGARGAGLTITASFPTS